MKKRISLIKQGASAQRKWLPRYKVAKVIAELGQLTSEGRNGSTVEEPHKPTRTWLACDRASGVDLQHNQMHVLFLIHKAITRAKSIGEWVQKSLYNMIGLFLADTKQIIAVVSEESAMDRDQRKMQA